VLTDVGRSKVLDLANYEHFAPFDIHIIFRLVEIAITAQVFYFKDRDYVVANSEIVPVDEVTGHMLRQRHFPINIHRAIQAKERVEVSNQLSPHLTDMYDIPFSLRKTNVINVNTFKPVNSRFTLSNPPQSNDDLPSRTEDKRQEYLAALLATIPDAGGYVEQAQSLQELNHGFRREMAARLQPVLNAHVQAMPRDTHDDKKAISRWVNEELRRFDLAIKCPKTGQPSLLFAGPGNHPEIGRFILEHKSPEGKRVRGVQTPELPVLELMEAAPRREAFVELHQRIGPQGGERTR
jgi:hypothetical protein